MMRDVERETFYEGGWEDSRRRDGLKVGDGGTGMIGVPPCGLRIQSLGPAVIKSGKWNTECSRKTRAIILQYKVHNSDVSKGFLPTSRWARMSKFGIQFLGIRKSSSLRKRGWKSRRENVYSTSSSTRSFLGCHVFIHTMLLYLTKVNLKFTQF